MPNKYIYRKCGGGVCVMSILVVVVLHHGKPKQKMCGTRKTVHHWNDLIVEINFWPFSFVTVCESDGVVPGSIIIFIGIDMCVCVICVTHSRVIPPVTPPFLDRLIDGKTNHTGGYRSYQFHAKSTIETIRPTAVGFRDQLLGRFEYGGSHQWWLSSV